MADAARPASRSQRDAAPLASRLKRPLPATHERFAHALLSDSIYIHLARANHQVDVDHTLIASPRPPSDGWRGIALHSGLSSEKPPTHRDCSQHGGRLLIPCAVQNTSSAFGRTGLMPVLRTGGRCWRPFRAETRSQRRILSKGHAVRRTRCPKDTLSEGQTVRRTDRPKDRPSEGQTFTARRGSSKQVFHRAIGVTLHGSLLSERRSRPGRRWRDAAPQAHIIP